MATQRLLIPEISFHSNPDAATGPTFFSPIALSTEESHHALHVLRLGLGTLIEGVNTKGVLQKGTLEKKGKQVWFCPMEAPQMTSWKAQLKPIHLMVGVPKKESMDWILEKATELGITSLQPIFSERSIASKSKKEWLTLFEKWQKKSNQALKQCRRTFSMTIGLPLSFTDWFSAYQSHPSQATSCSLWCDEQASSLFSFKKKIQQLDFSKIAQYDLLIGPEGGWSRSERECLMSSKKSFMRVSLGPLTLRTETACLYAANVLSFMSESIEHEYP